MAPPKLPPTKLWTVASNRNCFQRFESVERFESSFESFESFESVESVESFESLESFESFEDSANSMGVLVRRRWCSPRPPMLSSMPCLWQRCKMCMFAARCGTYSPGI